MFPTRRRSTPVVRRIVLAALLCVSFALVTVSYRGGVVLHGAQMQVLDVVAPIQRGLNRAWDPVAGAWDWTGRLFTAMGDNPELERENAELRTKLRVAAFQAEEDAKLLRLQHVSEQGVYPDGFDQVVGRVWGRQTGPVDRSVIIGVGTEDGVSIDDSVMVAEGLIGRIIAVDDHNATVGLILDSGQPPTAHIVGSEGGTGILQTVSTDGVPAMRIDKVRQSAKVDVGDEVVTAGFATPTGLRSMYARGIPIGQVTSVRNSAANEYKSIQVVPFADFDDIDHVIVLVAKDGAEPTYTVPTPPTRRSTIPPVSTPVAPSTPRASTRSTTVTSTATKQPAAASTSANEAPSTSADGAR